MKFSDNFKSLNRPHILIVDDEFYVADTVKEFLSEVKFDATICGNGPDTLAFLKNNHVDLILLDVAMPGMNGMEVARKIKDDKEATGYIPIIMVSAMDREEDKVAGLKFADDYVTKPFSYDELIARIKVHLRIGQLQNELLFSKSKYQSLYENIPEMCISIDRDRTISDCNMVFCECFGLKKEDVIGQKIIGFFDPYEHDILLSFFDSLEFQRIHTNTHLFRMNHTDLDGNPYLVSIRAVRIGESESGLDIIVSLKDMTTNVKLERQEKLARQQLYRSARLASIGTLASGTAHEMNNPLAAILGFADALLHRFEKGEHIDGSELKQYLGIIKSETLRCRDVVENLSKFSLDYESQSESIALDECLQSAIALINVRAQKKNIQIINNVQGAVIVNADAQKIGQVLIHILSNAIDFCKEGSTITIELEENRVKTDPVKLRISDNGPGIAENILHKIFDPFFTTKEVGKGIGLGMSISHKLMEECNGSIDVISKMGVGTTVVLEIPKD